MSDRERVLMVLGVGLSLLAILYRIWRERPANRDGNSGRFPDSHWQTNPRLSLPGRWPPTEGK